MNIMSLMASVAIDLAQFNRDLQSAQNAAKKFKRRPEMSGMALDVEANLDTEEFNDKLEELNDQLEDVNDDISIEGEADIDIGDFEDGIGEVVSLAENADADVDGDASLDSTDYSESIAELISLSESSDIDVEGEATLVSDGYELGISDVETAAEDADADVDGMAAIDIKPFTFGVDTLIELAESASDDASVDAEASLDTSGFDDAVDNAVSKVGELDGALGDIETSSGDADSSLESIGDDADYSGLVDKLGNVETGLKNIVTSAFNAVKAIAELAIDSSTWADDLITESQQFNLDTQTLQQMRYASKFIDTEVGTIESATLRLTRNIKSISEGAEGVTDAWETLSKKSGKDIPLFDAEGQFRPTLDVFFDIIDALSMMENETEREGLAQELLGRNVAELNPLIKAGTEAYRERMEEAPQVTEDNVIALGNLNDAYQDLQSQLEVTKLTLLADLAPSITEAVTALSGFVEKFREFVETEEGQTALENINNAISGLIRTLTDEGNIERIFTNLSNFITSISSGLEWIAENPESVVSAFEAIGLAISGIEVGKGLMTLLTVIQNGQLLKGLNAINSGGYAASDAARTASAAGAAGGAGAVKTAGSALISTLSSAAVAAPLTGVGLGIGAGIALDAYEVERDFGEANRTFARSGEILAAAQSANENIQQMADFYESLMPIYEQSDLDSTIAGFDYIQKNMDALSQLVNLSEAGWDTDWTEVNGGNVIDIASAIGKIMTQLAEGIESGEEIADTVSESITEGGEDGAVSMEESLEEQANFAADAIYNSIQKSLNNLHLPPLGIWNTGAGSEGHATGMSGGEILRGITPFGYDSDGTVHYGGEAGAEAVVGVNSLDRMIQNSVNSALGKIAGNSNGQPQIVRVQLVLDTGAILDEVDVGLNEKADWNGSGHA